MAVVPAEMAAGAKTNQVVFLEQQIWMLFLRQYMMSLELFGSSAYFASSAFRAYLRGQSLPRLIARPLQFLQQLGFRLLFLFLHLSLTLVSLDSTDLSNPQAQSFVAEYVRWIS